MKMTMQENSPRLTGPANLVRLGLIDCQKSWETASHAEPQCCLMFTICQLGRFLCNRNRRSSSLILTNFTWRCTQEPKVSTRLQDFKQKTKAHWKRECSVVVEDWMLENCYSVFPSWSLSKKSSLEVEELMLLLAYLAEEPNLDLTALFYQEYC